MIGLGTFKTGFFDREAFRDLSDSLKNKLPIEDQWVKVGVFTITPSSHEDSTGLKLFLGDHCFLSALRGLAIVNTAGLTEEEDAILQQVLKESNLIKKPSPVLPKILSAIHFIFLFVVAMVVVIGGRHPNDYVIGVLCGISLVLIPLGMILYYRALSKGKLARGLGFAFFILGALATMPSSLLQAPFFHALRAKHLYKTLYL